MILFSEGCSLVAVTVFLLVTEAKAAHPSVEQELISTLMKGYNRNARPVMNRKSQTNVTFGLEVVQLVNVDDRNQVITTNVWVRQRWKNQLLTWKREEYNGIKTIRMNPSLVWVPDIVLYNSADSVFSGGLEKYKTRVILENDGRNAWYSPASFRSTCNIDVTYFPFDEQVCSMKFGSWTFVLTDLDIDTENTPTLSDKYVKSAEWELIKASKERNVQFYKCCSVPFTDVTIVLVIRRKPLFYAFNLITPCMIMLSMILLGFFLPPESGERITLSITVLLAMAVFLQLVAETLPRNSETIPLLGKFYITIMTEVSLSLMSTCWVLNVHHKNSGGSIVRIPPWIELFVLGWVANVLCVRKPTMQLEKFPQEANECNLSDSRLIKVKVPSQAGEEHALLSGNHLTQVCLSNTHGQKRLCAHSNDVDKTSAEKKKTLDEQCIAKDLALLAAHTRKDRQIEENQKKWKHVAMVMDRFFFWFFVITVLISTLVIFKEKLRQQSLQHKS
ncbi:neuronal acetylcholine receptor subunit alpha-10-like [Montipora capricornis]|uniref:neuronal acetylcholine receptor subunit alpha-10-like n=1 Tax=Montipora capricornis TaxID=246305 RepID=UPI0035F1D410